MLVVGSPPATTSFFFCLLLCLSMAALSSSALAMYWSTLMRMASFERSFLTYFRPVMKYCRPCLYREKAVTRSLALSATTACFTSSIPFGINVLSIAQAGKEGDGGEERREGRRKGKEEGEGRSGVRGGRRRKGRGGARGRGRRRTGEGSGLECALSRCDDELR